MERRRILAGLGSDPVPLIVDQRSAGGIVEPWQERFPDAIEPLVVVGESGIGADLLVAGRLGTCLAAFAYSCPFVSAAGGALILR
jgi:hypothetical protein